MKKALLLPLILLFTASLACTISGFDISVGDRIAGSGDVVELDRDLAGFDSLDISNAFDVEVSQGNEYSVIIRIDDNLVDYLEVSLVGSELNIGMESGRNYGFTSITLEAEVTMPELSAIDASGASNARISGFSSDAAFRANVSGASNLEGELAAGDVRIDVSGASSVELSGSSSDLDLDVSGGSNVDFIDFASADASVHLSGASDVAVNVSGTLNVDASGASHVEYSGDPTLGRIELSGASSMDEK